MKFKEIPKNCRYTYARVSSKSQENNSSLEYQKQELLKQGVPEKNIRVEVGSAADLIRERPGFQKLIEKELQEVIDEANTRGLAMLFTGHRLFRH